MRRNFQVERAVEVSSIFLEGDKERAFPKFIERVRESLVYQKFSDELIKQYIEMSGIRPDNPKVIGAII